LSTDLLDGLIESNENRVLRKVISEKWTFAATAATKQKYHRSRTL